MPRALVSGIKEAEPHLVKQLLYRDSGIVKDLDLVVGTSKYFNSQDY